MKHIKFLFALTAVIAILFSACKKNKAEKSTLEKVQAKWNFQKEYYHDNYSGVDYRDTTYGVTGEYVDFRTDGKVYFHVDGGYDTATYSILGDNKIITTFTYSSSSYSDTATIQVLTDNQLQVYVKEFDIAPDYYEYTDYLSK